MGCALSRCDCQYSLANIKCCLMHAAYKRQARRKCRCIKRRPKCLRIRRKSRPNCSCTRSDCLSKCLPRPGCGPTLHHPCSTFKEVIYSPQVSCIMQPCTPEVSCIVTKPSNSCDNCCRCAPAEKKSVCVCSDPPERKVYLDCHCQTTQTTPRTRKPRSARSQSKSPSLAPREIRGEIREFSKVKSRPASPSGSPRNTTPPRNNTPPRNATPPRNTTPPRIPTPPKTPRGTTKAKKKVKKKITVTDNTYSHRESQTSHIRTETPVVVCKIHDPRPTHASTCPNSPRCERNPIVNRMGDNCSNYNYNCDNSNANCERPTTYSTFYATVNASQNCDIRPNSCGDGERACCDMPTLTSVLKNTSLTRSISTSPYTSPKSVRICTDDKTISVSSSRSSSVGRSSGCSGNCGNSSSASSCSFSCDAHDPDCPNNLCKFTVDAFFN